MRKVTFMGIDGSGKTTLLALKKAIGEAASFLHSPDFHEIPGFAGAEESRALTGFSRLADAYADPGLKLTSLYLRMCLFGEAEAHLASTERRNTLCIERHALIDSLTYLPVYIAAMKRSGLRAGDSAFVMLQIGNRHPVVFQAVHAALARRDRRLGIDTPTVGSAAEEHRLDGVRLDLREVFVCDDREAVVVNIRDPSREDPALDHHQDRRPAVLVEENTRLAVLPGAHGATPGFGLGRVRAAMASSGRRETEARRTRPAQKGNR